MLRRAALVLALLTLCCAARAAAGAWQRPAPKAAKPEQSVLLSVVLAGNRLVAVGERGLILYSDDDGRRWTQAMGPVSVTLTKALFVSPRVGWAVGHGGVILHTDDGGQSWGRQLDGLQAAQLAATKYVADSTDPALRQQAAAARQLILDGADKPFFDMLFVDQRTGFAVGAYGLIFHTSDGGAHWTPWMEHVDNPQGLHLYGMARDGATLFIAGEQGLLLRSTDGGQQFSRVPGPYKGSYFGMVSLSGGELYLYGLRGSLYRSVDHGAAWSKIEAPSQASFSAAFDLSATEAAFVNQAGQLFVIGGTGQILQSVPGIALAPYTSMARSAGGAWVLASMRGISRVEPGRPTASATGNEITK
ncbi:WD40/YVTN/BNR-like repeat-containing protein [Rugamonas apoptosis]|uniref:Glycosyl hydrolase n=1 Tax=Rugamonas apoptosis TaxID=2758570 RepID=A0A7W2F6N4_9BURK|nr:YCF48-related protein [Rugamonas apoptosis]MBA5686158.1 glycosyl hydrolase [Rugamonas apoptosis]